MGEPPGTLGGSPSWDEAGVATENADHAAWALGCVQDALRTAFPQQWASAAADGYSGRLIDLLGRSQRLGDAIAQVRAAAEVLAREVAAHEADGGP